MGIDDIKKYNIDKDIEKSPKILEGKINIKFNFKKILEGKINIKFNFKNYSSQNDIDNEQLLETLEKLKNENKYLNKIILKYKTEANMVDISLQTKISILIIQKIII